MPRKPHGRVAKVFHLWNGYCTGGKGRTSRSLAPLVNRVCSVAAVEVGFDTAAPPLDASSRRDLSRVFSPVMWDRPSLPEEVGNFCSSACSNAAWGSKPIPCSLSSLRKVMAEALGLASRTPHALLSTSMTIKLHSMFDSEHGNGWRQLRCDRVHEGRQLRIHTWPLFAAPSTSVKCLHSWSAVSTSMLETRTSVLSLGCSRRAVTDWQSPSNTPCIFSGAEWLQGRAMHHLVRSSHRQPAQRQQTCQAFL